MEASGPRLDDGRVGPWGLDACPLLVVALLDGRDPHALTARERVLVVREERPLGLRLRELGAVAECGRLPSAPGSVAAIRVWLVVPSGRTLNERSSLRRRAL